MSNRENLVGLRFGPWIVLQWSIAKGRSAFYCVCECGTKRMLRAHHLKAYRDKSCACRPAPLARFWAKTKRDGQCIIWTGAKQERGYGKFGVQGKSAAYAHRWIYEQIKGPIGDLQVCHHCDRPSCVNPEHLYLADQKRNMQDCAERDRDASGERHGNSKLTAEDVEVIRALRNVGVSRREIAERFGIAKTHVTKIATGWAWRRSA